MRKHLMAFLKKLIVVVACLLTTTSFGSIVEGQNEHIPGTSLNILNRGDNLRIMSYNVRIDNYKDKETENDWETRRNRVEWMIDHYDPDIIGIQEPSKNQLNDIIDELGDGYSIIFAEETPDAYLHPNKYPNAFYLETNAIMYKKERIELIGTAQKFWLAEDPSQPPVKPAWDGSDRSRVVIYALFRDIQTGQLFYTFNTHFETGGLVVRVESAKLLMETAKKIATTTPTLIMGDFNTFNDDNGIITYQALESYKDEFPNVYDVAENEFGKRGTWVGFRYSTFTEQELDEIYPGVPPRYDHMFVSNNVRVINTGVADDKFITDWKGSQVEVTSSDHRPIIADIALLCEAESEKLTLEKLVDQIAQGLVPDTTTAIPNNLEDSENTIPEIPETVLDNVSRYLNGERDLNVDSTITQENYRDYLNAAKFFDLLSTDGYEKTTYPIRLACFLKSKGKVKSLEAFSYRLNPEFFEDFNKQGEFIPNKKFELYHAGQFELTFVPEWVEIQKQITCEVIDTVNNFSKQLGYNNNPHLLLFTGTYGSGKSYQVHHHRLTENIDFDQNALFSGVLSSDAIKRVYMELVPGATNDQVHHEGVAIRLQIMKALFCYFPYASIIQEAVLSTESSIENQLILANENHFKINLIDTDADLETACLRILTRDPSKGDSIPHFRATVAAQKMIRTSRTILHHKVERNKEIIEYELIYSENGQSYLIAQKKEGKLQIAPGQEERFLKALSPTSSSLVEEVAQRVITEDDCLVYGNQLEKFIGMKIEDALLKLSKE